MILGTKKLAQILRLLTIVSALVSLTTNGYCAEALDPAKANVKVRAILQEAVPVMPSVQQNAKLVIQENKKFFISYCWKEEYSTVPMVDDFENFIKDLGIRNYYRDKRPEKEFGLTLGAHIENYMQNARDAHAVVIFLNDAYLKSRNCMYEFLQVWDANNKKISPHAFVLLHPNFQGLYGGPNAIIPYKDHWKGEFAKLNSQKIEPADRGDILDEMKFVTEVENNIAPIVRYLARYIQADYQQQRSSGFIDVFNRALGGEDEEKGEPAAQRELVVPPIAQGSVLKGKAVAAFAARPEENVVTPAPKGAGGAPEKLEVARSHTMYSSGPHSVTITTYPRPPWKKALMKAHGF